MMDASYLLNEIAHVRTVYENWAKETAIIEKFALLTIGAIWSWCSTNTSVDKAVGMGMVLIVWVPLLICILSSWRARAIYQDMQVAIAYLEKLESECLPKGEGWQQFICKNSKGFRVRTTYWFWWSLNLYLDKP